MRHSALRSSWAAALALMAVLVLAPQAGFAQAPQTINYQGSLTDPAGVPIDGTVDMTFRLYSDSGGTTLLWTEIHDVAAGNAPAVTVTDGVFNVTLGAVTSLTLADFDNPVWLGITVGTDPEMTPLQAVDAVGYALRAKGAETAVSSDDLVCSSCVAESELGFDTATQAELDSAVSTIGSSLGSLSCTAGQIPAWNGTVWACTADADTDTVGSLSCTAGQIPAWNGTIWACAADADTPDTDTVGALSCTPNQVPKWNGTIWACAADIDTDTDTVGALSCTPNQVPKWNGTIWACAADIDTDTDTVGALSCTANQIPKRNGTNTAWVCAADVDTDTQLNETQVETFVTNDALNLNANTTLGGAGILAAARRVVGSTASIPTGGTNFATVGCGAGEVATGGGFLSPGDNVHAYGSYPTGSPTPTGWRVDAKNTGGAPADVEAYVICATQ